MMEEIQRLEQGLETVRRSLGSMGSQPLPALEVAVMAQGNGERPDPEPSCGREEG